FQIPTVIRCLSHSSRRGSRARGKLGSRHKKRFCQIIIAIYNYSRMMRFLAFFLVFMLIDTLEPRTLFAMPTLWTSQSRGGGVSYFSANVDGQNLWVASDMSGIYHSANFGQAWQQLN